MPDFPKPGIVFKDITTLLKDPQAFRRALDLFTVLCGDQPVRQGAWPSRAAASSWAARWPTGWASGFVPVRKPGKLPGETIARTYDLEYGDGLRGDPRGRARRPGERVLVVDDVIATGGTARAAGELVGQLGGDGGRLRVPGRADVPERPRASSTGRRPEPHPLLSGGRGRTRYAYAQRSAADSLLAPVAQQDRAAVS